MSAKVVDIRTGASCVPAKMEPFGEWCEVDPEEVERAERQAIEEGGS